jgi:hypothetical protein
MADSPAQLREPELDISLFRGTGAEELPHEEAKPTPDGEGVLLLRNDAASLRLRHLSRKDNLFVNAFQAQAPLDPAQELPAFIVGERQRKIPQR